MQLSVQTLLVAVLGGTKWRFSQMPMAERREMIVKHILLGLPPWFQISFGSGGEQVLFELVDVQPNHLILPDSADSSQVDERCEQLELQQCPPEISAVLVARHEELAARHLFIVNAPETDKMRVYCAA